MPVEGGDGCSFAAVIASGTGPTCSAGPTCWLMPTGRRVRPGKEFFPRSCRVGRIGLPQFATRRCNCPGHQLLQCSDSACMVRLPGGVRRTLLPMESGDPRATHTHLELALRHTSVDRRNDRQHRNGARTRRSGGRCGHGGHFSDFRSRRADGLAGVGGRVQPQHWGGSGFRKLGVQR